MLYLPSGTSEAIYMEAPADAGGSKWWIGAYAPSNGGKDCLFTCWGEVGNDAAQGKIICLGPASRQRYNEKIQEKNGKGYICRATHNGMAWNKLNHLVLPEPVRPGLGADVFGTNAGKLEMSGSPDVSAKRLDLALFRCPKGYRLDHREWVGTTVAAPLFPNWQTFFPDPQEALKAVASIRDSRSLKGFTTISDSIPWADLDFTTPLSSGLWWLKDGFEVSLQWDF